MSLVSSPAVVLLVSSPRPLLAPTPRSIDQPGAATGSRRRRWAARFAADDRVAGVERVTAHSGRVGLASELTRRGASDDGCDARRGTGRRAG